ncbi:class I SAM-dependent methyltransferase [Desulfocurvibacter africanus]|uniref:class I SAM-dependent methyltransferase n=1 Tax=Desulfocurvibacter africanus TaxID=873 RepID=UPI002FD8DA53
MEFEPNELEQYIGSLPAESVWRPVRDHAGKLLRRGGGKFPDILPETLHGVELTGRSIVDLGCNLGAYSLLAAQGGAARVLGVDIDPAVVAGCRFLALDYGLTNTEFRVADFLKEDLKETFGLGMLIDFIGRSVVAKGKLHACLKAVAQVSHSELLFTLRPEYNSQNDLGCDHDSLSAFYPPGFLRHGRVQVLEYAAEILKQDWEISVDCPGRFREHNLKTRVRAFRKSNSDSK